jgi:hypothetical protein
MPFPWGQPIIMPVNAKCKHCNKELEQHGNVVVECHCEEAEQERALDRERRRQWAEARKPTFDEARQKNKRPLRPKE